MSKSNRRFNLGTARRPFTVEITVNPVFDLLVATWSARGDSEKTSSWSIGEEWLEDFRGLKSNSRNHESTESAQGPAKQP